MKARTAGLQTPAADMLLMLYSNEALLDMQARIVAAVPGQAPIQELHVTLLPAKASAKPLPPPPAFVEFFEEARLVTGEGFSSVFLRAADASQLELADYCKALAQALDAPGAWDPQRVFHISLTNRTGRRDDSVAQVWKYPATPV